MIWRFVKTKRKTDAEIEMDQRRADDARRRMDAMHERLEDAFRGLMAPKEKANGHD